MDNNLRELREKAEALMKLCKNESFLNVETGVNIKLHEQFMAVEAALRPSREEIADYLGKYDKWRKGGDGPQPEPKELGRYIQYAIEELRRG